MRAILFLLTISLLWACRPTAPDPAATIYPSTDSEIFEPTAATSSTLIKAMVVQQASNGVAVTGGYHYEYRYRYDGANRLIELDYQGYMARNDNGALGVSYTGSERSVATLTYNLAGELVALKLNKMDYYGQLISFPVVKVDGELLVYGQPSPYFVSPFLNQTIVRITATGRLAQLPRPFNGLPFAQFAVNTFGYDDGGNLKSITLAHLDTASRLQYTPLLKQIEHTKLVNNPFARSPAYAAAHFLARGGLSSSDPVYWPDLSQQMVLSEQRDWWYMQEGRIAFVREGSAQTRYVYHYNANKLPVSLVRKVFRSGQIYSDQVSFTY